MGISVWQLLIILAIVLVLFGAKRIRTLGGDLGSAIKNFRTAVKEGEDPEKLDEEEERKLTHSPSAPTGGVIDTEVASKSEEKTKV
jgi:sec-independent protein translocase protein TatA